MAAAAPRLLVAAPAVHRVARPARGVAAVGGGEVVGVGVAATTGALDEVVDLACAGVPAAPAHVAVAFEDVEP